MTNFQKILIRIQNDYDFFLRFLVDAVAALDGYELTNEERASLCTRDEALYQASIDPVWIEKTTGETSGRVDDVSGPLREFLDTLDTTSCVNDPGPTTLNDETTIATILRSRGNERFRAIYELVKTL